ncbi:hypothetical protein BDF14DRAFT_1768108 [Spinellus fusiger]|nr:hypothetical protein BDF14DRAFT_1768108 [Spinellus fusiger]
MPLLKLCYMLLHVITRYQISLNITKYQYILIYTNIYQYIPIYTIRFYCLFRPEETK